MSNTVSIFRACLVAAWVAGLYCPAAWGAEQSAVTNADVVGLRPGEYIWSPALAPQGPMAIVISLEAQRAYVYRNGVRIGASTASTGRKGRETPTGVFTILEKHRFHRSNRYNNAPMPFMQRLTWSGVALHGGPLPGYAASHGCIRLPLAFARELFAATSLGATVVITPGAPRSVRLAENDLLGPFPTDGAPASSEPYSWRPQTAPFGPVSVLVSSHDERLLVLRNGKLIGSGEVRIPAGALVGTQAFQFTGFNAQGQSQWIYLDVPGQEAVKGQAPKLLSAEELHIAPDYLKLVRSVLGPGATLVATDGGLLEGGAGKALMLLEGYGR